MAWTTGRLISSGLYQLGIAAISLAIAGCAAFEPELAATPVEAIEGPHAVPPPFPPPRPVKKPNPPAAIAAPAEPTEPTEPEAGPEAVPEATAAAEPIDP